MSIIFYICILIFIFTPQSNFRCTQNGGWRAEKADKRRRTEGMIGMKTEKERGSSYKLWSDHEGLQSRSMAGITTNTGIKELKLNQLLATLHRCMIHEMVLCREHKA